MVETVLCYLIKDNKVLFLLRNKKKNDINQNKYIGVGGHIEINENKEQALLREVKEETGLTLLDYIYHGEIIFSYDDNKEKMHLFSSSCFVGEEIICDEGELHWVNKEDIMSLPLWEGDKYFLPLLLNNETNIKLTLVYKNDQLIDVIKNRDN